ncbi:MAG: helix-turn-helix domain-containing protein [Ignavibacteria bacterium]
MYLIELYKLIEDGESFNVEFKRKFSSPEKIAKEMIAFANSKGGKIIFGVDDDRKIIGIDSEKGEIELVSSAAKFYCEPEVEFTTEIVSIKNSDLLVVDVPESKRKPHRLVNDGPDNNNKVYVRLNDKSVIASRETIQILKSLNNPNPLKITFGIIEKTLINYLNQHERITVKEFKKLVNISERRASRILVNLVRAGVLLHHRIDNYEFFSVQQEL